MFNHSKNTPNHDLSLRESEQHPHLRELYQMEIWSSVLQGNEGGMVHVHVAARVVSKHNHLLPPRNCIVIIN